MNKKEELLKQKPAVTQDQKHTGQNWIKPLREWIFDIKKATLVASSDNLSDMGQIIRKVGLNPTFLNKTIEMHFRSPWDFTAETLAQSRMRPAPTAEKNGAGSAENLQSFLWWTA